jgi:hypothetical protein
MIRHWIKPMLLALFVFTQAACTTAMERTWTKVPNLVIVAPENDARMQVSHEAIDFWNRTFAEIGTPFRLGPVVQVAAAVPVDVLQDLSARVVGQGGPVEFPESLQRLLGDLVMVLSEGDFVSFAARSALSRKVIVGIRSNRLPPLALPNVARNVIAHELGHAIGLGHNDDPTKLMCGRPAPCRPSLFQSQETKFFPLTDHEEALLLKMYPPNWTSRE